MRMPFNLTDKQKSISALMVAVFFSTSGSSLFKALEGEYPVGQRMFFLFFMMPLFVVILGLINGDLKKYVKTKCSQIHLFQGIGTFVIDGIYYWALPLLNLAEGTTFYMFYVPLMGFLSGLINKEPYTRLQWYSVTLGFLGVLIAVNPDEHFFSGDPTASGGMLVSAVLTAMSLLYFRRASTEESCWATLGWMGFYVTMVSLISILMFGVVPFEGIDLWIFLGCGLCSLGWYLPVTYAYSKTCSGNLSAWGYMLIPVHALFGWFFFQEILEWHTILGAAFLIGSGLMVLGKEDKVAS